MKFSSRFWAWSILHETSKLTARFFIRQFWIHYTTSWVCNLRTFIVGYFPLSHATRFREAASRRDAAGSRFPATNTLAGASCQRTRKRGPGARPTDRPVVFRASNCRPRGAWEVLQVPRLRGVMAITRPHVDPLARFNLSAVSGERSVPLDTVLRVHLALGVGAEQSARVLRDEFFEFLLILSLTFIMHAFPSTAFTFNAMTWKWILIKRWSIIKYSN